MNKETKNKLHAESLDPSFPCSGIVEWLEEIEAKLNAFPGMYVPCASETPNYAMEQPQPSCEACRYFHRFFVKVEGVEKQESTYGECKRYPPMIIIGKNDPRSPEVGIEWWCGEYKPKEG